MKFKPDNIKQDYEAHMIGTHSSKWELVFQRGDKHKTTKENIVSIAEEYRTDILVLGYHGRKGPKSDPTLLGSNVDEIAHNPVCPILVVKREENRKDKEDKAYRFVVCMDGRTKSYHALDTVLNIMDKDVDHLVILTVTRSHIDHEKIDSHTAEICEQAGVKNRTFELVQKDYGEQYAEAIVDYINIDDTQYVDFVAIANRGAEHTHVAGHDKYLGKRSKEVLFKSKANVLLVP